MKIFDKILKEKHKKLLALITDYRQRLIWAMGCMLLVSATSAASAYLVKPILDEIFVKKDVQMLAVIPMVILLVYFIRGVATYGQEYFMNYVGQGIIRHLRDMLFEKIVDLPLSFYHKEKTGVLMSRVTNDVSIIKNMVSNAVTGSLRDFFTLFLLTGVIFYQIWELALFAFVVLPLAFYPIVLFGRRVRRVSTGFQEAMADLNAYLHETFAGNKIVKAFGMEHFEKERFFRKTKALFRIEMKAVKAKSLSSPVMEFLGGGGVAFIVWYGGAKVIEGTYSVGTYFSFLTAVIMLYEPVKKLSKLNNSIQEGMAAADRVFDIIEKDSDITDPEAPIEFPSGFRHIQFKGVSFQYDRNEVLSQIDLTVKSGDVLALVGMSGGGKSSLVNLIPRFYDVTKGAICISDIDIRQMRVTDLRTHIAIVTQDPILFNDTIRNNIAYGRQTATEEDIIAAAKAAYAYEFVKGFPHGFETNIGELGGRLSGGEKQRICIARALLKDAPVLILDEATSALDTESEMLVQKALENLMQGRTTFVIAHRLSTIANANRIIVLKDGQIVEQGTHGDLIALNGEYAKLHQMQYRDEA